MNLETIKILAEKRNFKKYLYLWILKDTQAELTLKEVGLKLTAINDIDDYIDRQKALNGFIENLKQGVLPVKEE